MEFATTTWPLGAPGHSWMNVAGGAHSIGHKSLVFAAKVIASTAVELIMDPKNLEEAWKEFNEKTMEKVYKAPVPDDAKPPLNMWE